jgi:hypothetical protein
MIVKSLGGTIRVTQSSPTSLVISLRIPERGQLLEENLPRKEAKSLF